MPFFIEFQKEIYATGKSINVRRNFVRQKNNMLTILASFNVDTDLTSFSIKVWVTKMAHLQKLAINEKSTIFVQSPWKLVKMFA